MNFIIGKKYRINCVNCPNPEQDFVGWGILAEINPPDYEIGTYRFILPEEMEHVEGYFTAEEIVEELLDNPLPTDLQQKLIKLATSKAKSDNEDFSVYDYSGGNFDDAYYMGCGDGEILLAREILKELKISY